MKVALLLQAAAVALSKVVDSEAMISNLWQNKLVFFVHILPVLRADAGVQLTVLCSHRGRPSTTFLYLCQSDDLLRLRRQQVVGGWRGWPAQTAPLRNCLFLAIALLM